MRRFVVLLCMCASLSVFSQEKEDVASSGIWDNWYLEAGMDMSLQNPYGCNFSAVFPNGKTFGIDVAAGKWFTPFFGLRAKVNWENGIRLFENGHANWLAPFYKPGENMDKGGYVALYGDLQFNLHHLFGEFDADRRWTAILYPRAGAVYNCGAGDGSPVLGAGIQNVFRLSDRWNLYLDLAYNMTSSAVAEAGNTDVDNSSNGYFDINVGVRVDLGKKGELKTKREELRRKDRPFWSDWFVQAGLDMSLQNPYGCNFSNVFPNGKTFGLDIAVGKWFTPEVAVRGKVNWENGLIENKSVKWVPPVESPRDNYSGGGYMVASADVLFNLHNIFGGYDPYRKWTLSVYPRAGIIKQFEIGSGSPLVGAGIENQYRLTDRLGLYADVDYQVTTSESSASVTGSNAGSNGFFKVELGVTYDIGVKRMFQRVEGSSHTGTYQRSECHNWPRFIVNTAASVGVAFGAKTVLKSIVKEERPDHSDHKSFPSGHAAMAFAAARSLDKEFRKESIWIPIAGYAAATAIGVERVASDRHHWYDVVAGAAVGVGSAELTWWLSDKIFGRDSHVAVGSSGNTVDVKYSF